MKKPNTTVVIPNLDGKRIISQAIESLLKQTVLLHIIVVDNGSKDDSASFIHKKYNTVEVIELPENLGFAGGVNVGIKRAQDLGFKYIALLNNDAEVETSWLEELLVSIEDNNVGIATCKLFRSDQEHLDSTGDFYTIWGMPFPRGRNQIANDKFSKEEEVFSASGGASLYRSALFDDIGLFDEKFFAYFEDVDISFRARLRGWKVVYNPKAIAYHAVSATSSKMGSGFSRYHSIKNFSLLYMKCMPGLLFWKYLPLVLIQHLRMGLGSIKAGSPLVYIKATFATIFLIPSTLIKRHKIQSSRKISPKEIDSLLIKSTPPKIPLI